MRTRTLDRWQPTWANCRRSSHAADWTSPNSKFRQREEWQADANWKVMIENYLECYHCPVQHPGFSSVVDVDQEAYQLRPYEWFSSQVAPVRPSVLQGKGKKAAYDAHGAVTQAQYHLLWPNFTININPGHPNLSVDIWLPDGPERTCGFSEQYFGPDVPDDFAEQLIEFNTQVGVEDDVLTNSVQRGLHAGLPAQGRFLVKTERLVIHFQKLVLAALNVISREPRLRRGAAALWKQRQPYGS